MSIIVEAIGVIGPVYLSALCLFGAVAFIFAGIGILVAETLHMVGWL